MSQDFFKTILFRGVCATRTISVFIAIAMIQGCSYFGSEDEENSLLPAELIDFQETINVKKQWRASIGKSHEGLGIRLSPSTDGETIYAASFDGNVTALNAKNGRKIWKNNFDLTFTSGPAYKDGILVLGTSNGELIAVDSLTGELLWSVNVSSEILAPASIKGNQIFIRTVDGNLTALSIEDGGTLWTVNHKVPKLSLRGTTGPVSFANAVLSGFDDGKVSAYDINDGMLLWETMLTPPGGRTEIEKITDIDAPLVIQGSEVYAGSYQGALGGMALESGNLIWLIEASIYSGIATDDDDIYVSQADGSVMALSRFTGREIWKKENLLNRYPSAPALLENSLIIGDLEGYIHWLDKKTGETQQRISVGSSKITSTPLILDRTIYVLTDDGDLISILTLSNSS